jgi:hypothetical protein
MIANTNPTHGATNTRPTHATATTPISLGIKRKISIVFMPIIEAFDKALDWINTKQLEIDKNT